METSLLTRRLIYNLYTLCLFSFGSLYAQEFNPSTWATFVQGGSNPVVVDTFLLQTFNNDLSDNWGYQISGEATLFDAKAAGIQDASEGLAMKLPVGSQLVMDNFPPWEYTQGSITLVYAAQSLRIGDKLILSAKREKPVVNHVWLNPTKGGYSVSFLETKEEATANRYYIRILDNPTNASLRVAATQEGSGIGYYAVDSAYATREIQNYSLFTGSGPWSDAARWTHYPANGRRNALVNGDLLVDKTTSCDKLFLGDGTVSIAAEETLRLNSLGFYGGESQLFSAGNIQVTGKVTVYRTFPEKQKWYFVSFPFDVYPEDVEPGFTLQDETFEGSGNYYYMYVYNGDKRAESNGINLNWEAVPSAKALSGEPLFEKNKGYLIALDENAEQSTLSFSSRPGDIPETFASEGEIPITISSPSAGVKPEHYGWYLCGNPLPAPLPLSRIEANDDLDGYAYVYEDGQFKSYPLTSDVALPPFSAFFVKAKRSTTLHIQNNEPISNIHILPAFDALPNVKQDPQPHFAETTSAPFPQFKTPRSYMLVNSLFLEDLLMPGVVYVVDFMGRILWQKEVSAGSSVIELPLVKGVNLLIIDTKNYKAQYKFIRHQ